MESEQRVLRHEARVRAHARARQRVGDQHLFVEGKTGAAGMAGYVAAKHGVHGLTKSAAAEVGRSGITVNAICPGLILTDAVLQGGPGTAAAMGMSYDEMVDKVFKSKTLTGELNTVEQVAAVAVLLASDTGRGITGSFFNVDGGQSPY